MKTLHLNLKRKWFDMILSGEKREEYRDITDYWARRLIAVRDPCGMEFNVWDEMVTDLRDPQKRHNSANELCAYFDVELKPYTTITFSNGYAKNRPQFVIELERICVGKGTLVWGASALNHFILRLGKILEITSPAEIG